MLPSEEIKTKLNVVDFVGEYVKLKKSGANFRGLCPFHQEKTPSFMVSPTKQIWHCFGCGLGGDVFEFVKQLEGVEFPEALQILAARAGIVLERPTIEYQKSSDEKKTLYAINELAARFYAKVLSDSQVAAEAREYLSKRGFRPETIAAWQLGYAPNDFHTFENFITKKGYQKSEAVKAGLLIEKDGGFFDRFRDRVMFPLLDQHGRVVGFTARILHETEGAAKYVNSPETGIYSKSYLVYGLHAAKTAIRHTDSVVVVEGNADVITCHEAGFKNVVGSSGTAFTSGQLELLKRFSPNLIFAFDVDEAGLLATRRAVELALTQGFNVKIASIPKGLAKDPDELIRRDPALWQGTVEAAKNFLDFYFDAVFANLNLEDSLAKKQAVAELVPLLSLLPDPLDRGHYLQRLALKLLVDEKLLLELLNRRLQAREQKTPASRPSPVKKTRQELLERRVLSLLFRTGAEFPDEWAVLSDDDFTYPFLQQVFFEVKPLIQNHNFDPDAVIMSHPKWQPELELLLFGLENELALSPDIPIQELKKQFVSELKLLTTRRKMNELVNRIKAAEQIGRSEEVRNLTSEFNNLSMELAKFNVG